MLLWSHFSDALSSFLFLLLFGSFISYAQTTKLNCCRFTSSFCLPRMQIKPIMSIQFCFDFTLRRTLFIFFGVWLTLSFFVHLNNDSTPNVFEYGLQDKTCQTGICLGTNPHHSLFFSFFWNAHIHWNCQVFNDVIWIIPLLADSIDWKAIAFD